MARAPNYRFERNERDRKKAAKKAAKAEKRKAARDETGEGPATGEGGETTDPSAGTADDQTSPPKPLP